MTRKFVVTMVMFAVVVMSAAIISQAQDNDGPRRGPKHIRGFAGPGGPEGPGLFILEDILSETEAPALSSEQKEKIQSLIKNFRDESKPPQVNEELKAARLAYANAILAGDLELAESQARLLDATRAEAMANRHKAVAQFQIEVISILKSGGQFEALKNKLGAEKVVFLIGPMAGGGMVHKEKIGPGPGKGKGKAFHIEIDEDN